MKNPLYCGFAIGLLAVAGAAGQSQGQGPVALDAPYHVRYASNLTISDAVINITNTGANGNSLFGPGFGQPAGNICVNVYAFSPDEQLISCCSCLVTPNGLVHVTANNDLVSNTLTGIKPDSIVIKLVSTSTGSDYQHLPGGVGINVPTFDGSNCTNSAALAGGNKYQVATSLLAWGTSTHSCSSSGVAAPSPNLPPGEVTTQVTFSLSLSLPSYITVQFPGLASGFDVNSVDTYLAWCANFLGSLPVNPTANPDIYSSLQLYKLYNTYGALPVNGMSPNWDNVNYLLNHKGSASVAAIQEAIWFLLNGAYHTNAFIPSVPPPGADALVADALANGNGFIPAAGQKVAVLLDSESGLLGTGLQDILIEVSVPDPHCTNITETGFIPATLSHDELTSITNRCANIIGNGSTFGQCRSCRLGGLGGSKQ